MKKTQEHAPIHGLGHGRAPVYGPAPTHAPAPSHAPAHTAYEPHAYQEDPKPKVTKVIEPVAGIVRVSVVRAEGESKVQAPSGKVRRVDLGGHGGTINVYVESASPGQTSEVTFLVVRMGMGVGRGNYLGSVEDAAAGVLFVYCDELSV